MGFWIQLGVSGFRMDAVPFVIAHQGRLTSTEPREQYDMLRYFREFLQWRVRQFDHPCRGECHAENDMEYFGDAGDRMHMMFNFQVNQNLFYALATADSTAAASKRMRGNQAIDPPAASGACSCAIMTSSISGA